MNHKNITLSEENTGSLPVSTTKSLQAAREEDNEPRFDSTNFRAEWREAFDALSLGMFAKKTHAYRGLKLQDFRRSACRNMLKDRVLQVVAMAISGHQTDSIFKR